MNSPSISNSETRRDESFSDKDFSEVGDRIARIAQQAESRTEFLQLVGAELEEAFQVGIVALESGEWASPMMLVSDSELARQIDRSKIRELLTSAAIVPIACDVPLSSEMQPANTRGLRIELTSSPTRAAILLIYSVDQIADPLGQIQDLKQLGGFAEAVRGEITIFNSRSKTELIVDPNSAASASRSALQQFHADLDVETTTYRIANESRRLLKADRATLLMPKSGKLRVRAMSGVAVIDSRSNAVKSTEEFVRHAAMLSRPIAFPNDEPLPPQVEEPLDDYLDQCGVASTVLLPLHLPDHSEQDDALTVSPFESTGDLIAVILLEYFAGDAPEVNDAMKVVSTEAMLALRNATEHEKIFGLSLWKAVGTVYQALRSPIAVCASVLCICLICAGLIVQTQHHVIATGTIQPTSQRQVFAAMDGVVKDVLVRDGDIVSAGQPLLVLENADLESQAETLSGDILAKTKRLSSIKTVRLSPTQEASQVQRLVLEQRQLESDLANLQAQMKLVQQQQEELTVRSPIDGKVVAWQLERRLGRRPISRGNAVAMVVDSNGPWELRLQLPDRDSGPVVNCLKEQETLPVQFAVATTPGNSFAASLNEVATSTRVDEAGQYIVDVTAAITEPFKDGQDSFSPNNVRVGADVTAKIACGRRSLLSSWFSDVIDFVDRNILFYVR